MRISTGKRQQQRKEPSQSSPNKVSNPQSKQKEPKREPEATN